VYDLEIFANKHTDHYDKTISSADVTM